MEEDYSFDDLARGLAEGTISRSRALKLVGTAILGGALGFLALPDEAEARKRRRRRRRRRARGRGRGGGGGCGPGHTPCRRPNGNVVCCESNETCSNQGCIRKCDDPGQCTTTDPLPHRCAANDNCRCFETTEGVNFCIDLREYTTCGAQCTSTFDATNGCPPGSNCVAGTTTTTLAGTNQCCPGTNQCVPASTSCG